MCEFFGWDFLRILRYNESFLRPGANDLLCFAPDCRSTLTEVCVLPPELMLHAFFCSSKSEEVYFFLPFPVEGAGGGRGVPFGLLLPSKEVVAL